MHDKLALLLGIGQILHTFLVKVGAIGHPALSVRLHNVSAGGILYADLRTGLRDTHAVVVDTRNQALSLFIGRLCVRRPLLIIDR